MDLFNIYNYISEEMVLQIIRVILVVVIAVPVLLLLRNWARSFFTKNYSTHYGMLGGKVVFYSGIIVILITILGQLGISLAPLLAGAGIVGVALGFASQTSVSNIISGLFLIAEQPFKVDDIINVNGTIGIVMSIDVLSVKLRTFDNMFVRIPNEMIIKTEVINLTRFPIRRFNAKVSVAYKEDISKVREILMKVAEKNKYSLSEPAPQIIFEAFGTSSIDLDFRIWAPVDEWIHLKNTIQEEIKKRFDEEEIEIPFPHLSFYTGSESEPLPIEMVNRTENSQKETDG